MAKVVLSTILIILISVASSSPITSRDSGWCPDAWVAFGSSCYYLITGNHTWSESQAICKTKSSSLVQIESQMEDEFVVILALKIDESVWIGLNDREKEGNFVWADTQRVQTYTHWAPGEPNDLQQNEDCVCLWSKNKSMWFDAICENKYSAICEKHYFW